MIFTLTAGIAQGRFATLSQLEPLRQAGVTHLLNVSDTPSHLQAEDGPFAEVAWHPLADDRRLPNDQALGVLDALHRMVCQPGSRVYVHCVAGWIRSPTIVWLYLLACARDREQTTQAIVSRNYDAQPGHPGLIDDELIRLVVQHGQGHYLPHPRGEVLDFS